jgi:hypothetical protein
VKLISKESTSSIKSDVAHEGNRRRKAVKISESGLAFHRYRKETFVELELSKAGVRDPLETTKRASR